MEQQQKRLTVLIEGKDEVFHQEETSAFILVGFYKGQEAVQVSYTSISEDLQEVYVLHSMATQIEEVFNVLKDKENLSEIKEHMKLVNEILLGTEQMTLDILDRPPYLGELINKEDPLHILIKDGDNVLVDRLFDTFVLNIAQTVDESSFELMGSMGGYPKVGDLVHSTASIVRELVNQKIPATTENEMDRIVMAGDILCKVRKTLLHRFKNKR